MKINFKLGLIILLMLQTTFALDTLKKATFDNQSAKFTSVNWPAPWKGRSNNKVSNTVFPSEYTPTPVVPKVSGLTVIRSQAGDKLNKILFSHESLTYTFWLEIYPGVNPAEATMLGVDGVGRDFGKTIVFTGSLAEPKDSNILNLSTDSHILMNIYYTVVPSESFLTHPPSLEKPVWQLLGAVSLEDDTDWYRYCQRFWLNDDSLTMRSLIGNTDWCDTQPFFEEGIDFQIK